jgi:phosphatidylserine/phosphatidylglycerophosphate/cardiolipin synthase-like enzyme
MIRSKLQFHRVLSFVLITMQLVHAQTTPPLWKNTLVINPAQISPILSEPTTDPMLGLHDNGVTAPAYDIIIQAKSSLDIEIYELKDTTFRQLLLNAAARKVKIRIIKDPATIADTCDELAAPLATDKPVCLEEKKFVSLLKKAGGSYTYFNKMNLCGVPGKICYMHGKLIIADKKRALLSSGNFSTSSLCGGLDKMPKKPSACNRDYTYVTANKIIIEKLQNIFNKDLEETDYDLKKAVIGKDGKINITVSPTAAHTLITLIKMAKSQILISTQYLNDPLVNHELMSAAHMRKVQVKVLVADLCYYGAKSMSATAKVNNRKVFDMMENAGVEPLFFTKDLRVAGKTGYNHSKAMVIDGKLAWIGSINFSEESLYKNREFGVLFTNPKEVKKLINSIDGDMTNPGAISWEKEKVRCGI